MACGAMNPIIMMILISMLIIKSLFTNNLYILTFSLSHSLPIPINIDIMMNWFSLSFMFTVMLISLAIIKYSKSYVNKNNLKLFMMILTLFIMSMITLILSNNIIFIILGWDGLGLSSYILVIFYQNNSSSSAGTITIITNRLGDIMIIMAIIMSMQSGLWSLNNSNNMSSITLILLMIAAMTKSAQYPFTAWLPAAMAAPTPVSALVHSSTLVTAGVLLMMRMSNYMHPSMMYILLIMSLMTSLTASLSAMWEMDLKKMIALSTLSQIAFMMTAVSLNLINLAHFHLITHALFKATMFMSIGSMIHQTSYQDSRSIKNTYIQSPMINSAFSMTSMALSGLPFMSGFYSKDAILESSPKFNMTLTTMMYLSIMMTTMYNIRMAMNMLSASSMINPTTMTHKMNSMTKNTFMMSILSIFTGSTMMWTIPSMNNPSMNSFTKTLPIMILLLAMIMSMNIQMKSNMKLINKISSSMWMMNMLTTTPMINIMMLGHNTLQYDNSWKEMYSTMNNNLLNKMVLNTNNMKFFTMMTLIIMSPLIMLK